MVIVMENEDFELFEPTDEERANTLAEREEGPIMLSYDEVILDLLAEKGYIEEYGARNLRRMIESDIENEIAICILESRKNNSYPLRRC